VDVGDGDVDARAELNDDLEYNDVAECLDRLERAVHPELYRGSGQGERLHHPPPTDGRATWRGAPLRASGKYGTRGGKRARAKKEKAAAAIAAGSAADGSSAAAASSGDAAASSGAAAGSSMPFSWAYGKAAGGDKGSGGKGSGAKGYKGKNKKGSGAKGCKGKNKKGKDKFGKDKYT